MSDRKIFIGILRSNGGPYVTSYLIGEKSEKQGIGSITLKNIVHGFDLLTKTGIAPTLAPNPFLMTDKDTSIQLDEFLYYRDLDPVTDAEALRDYNNVMTSYRAQRSGLVMGGRKVIQEQK